MLRWIKDQLSGGKGEPEENLAGMPEPLVEALRSSVRKLEEKKPGASGRLLDYVLNDRGAEVLQWLSALPDAPSLLALVSVDAYHLDPEVLREKGQFWEKVEVRDPRSILRLAAVYQAAGAGSSPRMLFGDVLAEVRWLEVLVQEATTSTPANQWPKRMSEANLSVETLEDLLE